MGFFLLTLVWHTLLPHIPVAIAHQTEFIQDRGSKKLEVGEKKLEVREKKLDGGNDFDSSPATNVLLPTSNVLPPASNILLPTSITLPSRFSAKPTPTAKPKPSQLQDPLRTAINSFRSTHGLGLLSPHSLLCSVAESRWQQQIATGSLDNHAGFGNFRDTLKQSFHSWGEVLHFSSPAWNASSVITNGWATSTAGHREAMLTSLYTHGCGKIGSGFAVFVFGEKK